MKWKVDFFIQLSNIRLFDEIQIDLTDVNLNLSGLFGLWKLFSIQYVIYLSKRKIKSLKLFYSFPEHDMVDSMFRYC